MRARLRCSLKHFLNNSGGSVWALSSTENLKNVDFWKSQLFLYHKSTWFMGTWSHGLSVREAKRWRGRHREDRTAQRGWLKKCWKTGWVLLGREESRLDPNSRNVWSTGSSDYFHGFGSLLVSCQGTTEVLTDSSITQKHIQRFQIGQTVMYDGAQSCLCTTWQRSIPGRDVKTSTWVWEMSTITTL